MVKTSTWLYLAPLYVAWRIAWANRLPIMDCDEVYNYWEPLHFLEYGTGLQTWEYAPQYALRTYAYLWPMRIFSWCLSSLSPSLAPMLVNHPISSDKLALFVVLRSLLAGLSACTEWMFLTALSESVPFAESLQRQTLINAPTAYASAMVLLTSTGMSHASGALLPSSSVMILWTLCATCYVRNQIRAFCAVAVIATLCLGWPFGVVCFLPMGVDVLARKTQTAVRLLLEVAVWTVLVQAVVMWIDYPHYDKWTSPTLNIFRYNAQGGGDELYGIEPMSYYVKNLALNFNYIAVLGFLFLPLSAILRLCGRPLPTSLIVVVSSVYLWMSIVLPRPHKEERFLFPIYPPLCIAAVVVVQQVWDGGCACFSAPSNKGYRRHFWIVLLIPACLISLSRSMALSNYYTAPLQVYAALPATTADNQDRLVCTCGEWYRFPSSYYLPQGYTLGFLPSSFTGQLPKAFEREGSRAGSNFNDLNKEERDRYVDPTDCDFIVELETSNDAECLRVMKDNDADWTKVANVPYLNAAQTSTLHRILYLPFLHKAEYNSYSLHAKQPAKNDEQVP